MIKLSDDDKSIFLRDPNFGNKDEYHRNRVNTRSRGNEILIGGADYWPTDHMIVMEFNTLTQQEINKLIDFLSKNVGKMITLLDHENTTFTGIITTPSPEIKDERGDGCTFSTSLTFQI